MYLSWVYRPLLGAEHESEYLESDLDIPAGSYLDFVPCNVGKEQG